MRQILQILVPPPRQHHDVEELHVSDLSHIPEEFTLPLVSSLRADEFAPSCSSSTPLTSIFETFETSTSQSAIADLCIYLWDILHDEDQYEKFLNCRGKRAQFFLDVLQAVSLILCW